MALAIERQTAKSTLAADCNVTGNRLLSVDTGSVQIDGVVFTGNQVVGGGGAPHGFTNSTITGNYFGSDLGLDLDGCTVSANYIYGVNPTPRDLDVIGASNKVMGNTLGYGNLTVSGGADNTVTGNNALYMAISGGGISTVTGNIVEVNLSVTSSPNATVTGNTAAEDIVVDGSGATVTGNTALVNMTVTGAGCVVDGNKVAGILTVTGLGCIVSDNEPDLIRVTGDGSHIAGNRVIAATHGGTANGGTATTMLCPTQTEPDDYFNDFVVNITGGTGSGQTRLVSDWVNSTGTLTVTVAWGTNPDITSIYTIVGGKLITDSDEVVIRGNTVGGDIEVSGDRLNISGNNLDYNSIIGTGSTFCTIANNTKVGQLTFTGNAQTVTGNSGQLGSAPDWSVGGIDCIVMGNRLPLANLIVPGIDCIIMGNRTAGIGINAASAGPIPAGTVAVGNKVGATDVIYGAATAGPGLDNNIV